MSAERAAYRADHPHRWYVLYGYDDRRTLANMSGEDLMDLRVRTQRGDAIGAASFASTPITGTINRVRVSTGEGTAAWIDADDLRFDPANRVVVTDLSRGEVDIMAHAPLLNPRRPEMRVAETPQGAGFSPAPSHVRNAAARARV